MSPLEWMEEEQGTHDLEDLLALVNAALEDGADFAGIGHALREETDCNAGIAIHLSKELLHHIVESSPTDRANADRAKKVLSVQYGRSRLLS